MPRTDLDRAKNRDDEMKPGQPPRPASEPPGAEGSARNTKTLTDPATGEPQDQSGTPRPAQEERPTRDDRPA